MIKLGIIGATGKMGKALIEASQPDKTFEIVKISRSEPLQEAPLHTLDILIDVSNVLSLKENLEAALTHHLPIVIGTTGHGEKQHSLMDLASKTIPLLYSSNFSIGIHLIKAFIEQHAATLEKSFVDIIEKHHLDKKDLPSGTALDLAHLFKNKKPLLHTPEKRSQEDLVIHSMRLPSHPGGHTLQLALKDEMISLEHNVTDRKVYAHGALLAAKFLTKQPKGFYSFADVFANLSK